MNSNSKKLEVDLTNYSATAKSSLSRKPRRRKLTQACLGFGAATSAALGGSWLDADIIYSGIQNIVIEAGAGLVNTSIDLDGGGNDFKFEIKPNGGYAIVSGIFQNLGTVAGTGQIALSAEPFRPAQKFSSGELIGTAGSNLGQAGTGAIDPLQWANAFLYQGANGWAQPGFTSSPGFLGVQLVSGNFGWIRVHVETDAPNVDKVTIIDWAYDDMGEHIIAGAGALGGEAVVPEPTSAMIFMTVGLLSMGAAGVREHRRRKREAAKSTKAVASE